MRTVLFFVGLLCCVQVMGTVTVEMHISAVEHEEPAVVASGMI